MDSNTAYHSEMNFLIVLETTGSAGGGPRML